MKIISIISLVSCFSFSTAMINLSSAQEYQQNQFQDQAQVIVANPIYESRQISKPVTRCYDEKVYNHFDNNQYDSRSNDSNYGGLILGGVVGAATGSRFGGGHGKDVATVAGTIVGAMLGDSLSKTGDKLANQSQAHPNHFSVERRCSSDNRYATEQVIIGYKVKYRYKGRYFWTRTYNHPGRYIDINVQLQPLG